MSMGVGTGMNDVSNYYFEVLAEPTGNKGDDMQMDKRYYLLKYCCPELLDRELFFLNKRMNSKTSN